MYPPNDFKVFGMRFDISLSVSTFDSIVTCRGFTSGQFNAGVSNIRFGSGVDNDK